MYDAARGKYTHGLAGFIDYREVTVPTVLHTPNCLPHRLAWPGHYRRRRHATFQGLFESPADGQDAAEQVALGEDTRQGTISTTDENTADAMPAHLLDRVGNGGPRAQTNEWTGPKAADTLDLEIAGQFHWRVRRT